MNVIFIRHADCEAAGPEGDAGRRLTDEGRAQARTTAKALQKLGLQFKLILSSPLVRALQTAEVIAEVHANAKVSAANCLMPSEQFQVDPVKSKLAELVAEGLPSVALVGHAPSLDQCIGQLVAGVTATGISLSKAGAACVELPAKDSPTGMELRWLMRHDQLVALAGLP